jgi:lysophospholipid acyltransferase (LPLAT)-like uncharacterized protein
MWSKLKTRVIWSILWLIATAISVTLRIKCHGEEILTAIEREGKGAILATWHGSTMIPIYYLSHRGFYAIASVSRDGELQSRLLASRGYKLIRGSSARGGVRVLLESERHLRGGAVLALTPDGPRGPNREMQPGTVQIAARTKSPIIPIGVACQWGKRVRSWDRHLIPCPFARAAVYLGEPIVVDESVRTIEEWSDIVRDALNAADESAAIMIGGRSV